MGVVRATKLREFLWNGETIDFTENSMDHLPMMEFLKCLSQSVHWGRTRAKIFLTSHNVHFCKFFHSLKFVSHRR